MMKCCVTNWRLGNLRLPFFILSLLFFSAIVKADYTSNSGSDLDFDTGSTWTGNTSPGDTPNARVTISSGSDVIKDGSLTVSQGLYVYGDLTIDGVLNANSNTVYVGSSTNSSASLTVTGDFNLSTGLDIYGTVTIEGSLEGGNGITVESGGTLIIYGDFDTSQSITVKQGGTLIVYGNLDSDHWLYVYGNVYVAGDLEITGLNVYSSGNVVISGDLNISSNWGADVDGSNSDNIYLIGDNSTVNNPNNYNLDVVSGGQGTLSDLKTNDSDLYNELVNSGIIVEDPISFTATADGTDPKIVLEWILNKSSDSIMIAYCLDDEFGTPVKGETYVTGNEIDGGGKVLYIGAGTDLTYTHTPLIYGKTYYYKIWSTHKGVYSQGIEKKDKTVSKTTTKRALYETWEDIDDDTGVWTMSSSADEAKPSYYSNESYYVTKSGSNYWDEDGDAVSYDNSGHSAYVTYDTWKFSSNYQAGWLSEYANNHYYYYTNYSNNGAAYNPEKECTTTISTTFSLADFKSGDPCTLSFYWLCKGSSTYNGASDDDYGCVYITDLSGNMIGKISNPRSSNQQDWKDDYLLGGDDSSTGHYRYYGASDEWQYESVDLSDVAGLSNYWGTTTSLKLVFEWYNYAAGANATAKDPGFCIDNIVINNTTSSVVVDTDETTKPKTSVSSIANKEADAVDVFEFYFQDEANPNSPTLKNLTTTVKQFQITQGSKNETSLSDWTDAIAGAELRKADGSNTVVATGTVNSDNITFTFDNAITINDGETSDIYELCIWLNTDLNDNGISDGDNFDFEIEADNIVTGEGEDFEAGQTISSGAVPISVVATKLVYSTEPSSTATSGVNLSTQPIVKAVDKNGNVDVDFEENINLAITDGSDVTMSSYTVSVTDGEAEFSSLSLTLKSGVTSATITLTATYTGATAVYSNLKSGSVESTDIVIYASVSGTGNDSFYINQVKFNDPDINVTSGSNYNSNTHISYGDYTSSATTLTVGTTYSNFTATVKNGYKTGSNTKYDGYVYVFVDWNQDGDFIDTDEECIVSSKVSWGNSIQTAIYNGSITVPPTAKIGTTRMRVIFNAVTQNGKASSSGSIATETEDYTIVVKAADLTWTGATSTAWNVTTNWTPNKVPASGYNATIPSGLTNYPVISTGAATYNLIIASGASVNVSAGDTVHVYGAFENSGTFIVNNDLTDNAESISSIVIDGDVDGVATEVWSNMEYDMWWYISNPVDVSGFINSVPTYCGTLESDYYLDDYNNTSLGWHDNATASSSSETTAYGFAILNSGKSILKYTGSFNSGDSYSIEAGTSKNDDVSYYQFVGNPYPSYIDCEEIYASSTRNSTAANGTGEDAVGATYYVYTTGYKGTGNSSDSGRGYATYNAYSHASVLGGARYISPGQCFWVEAVNSDVIKIPKSACTNTPGTSTVSLKSVSSSSDTRTKILLTLSNDNAYDEVLILSDDEYGSDIVTASDSKKKMNSGTIGNIYTIKEDNYMVINSLPEFYDGEIIPLGYKVSNSGTTSFTIKVSSLSNVEDYDVYLDDLEEGTSINLKETDEYTFSTKETLEDDRFQIRVASSGSSEEGETTTGMDDGTTSNNIFVYSSGQTAYVTVSEEWLQSSSRKIDVYNVAGQLIQEVDLNDLETSFTLPDTGVYLIKVVSGSMIYTEKVLGK